MQCVVLAGGLGTRMRPKTERLPKSMLPVRGVPFVHHQLTLMAAQGFDHFVYCVGHLGSQLQSFVGDGSRWGVRVDYADEGNDLRGTGGALRVARDAELLESRFAVVYGDSYLPIDARAVWATAVADPRPALMTVFPNPGGLETPNVIFVDGTVLLYDKRKTLPEMRHVDYGLSVLKRELIDEDVLAGETVDLGDVFRALSVDGLLAGVEVKARFYEIGSEAGLADLEAYLASHP